MPKPMPVHYTTIEKQAIINYGGQMTFELEPRIYQSNEFLTCTLFGSKNIRINVKSIMDGNAPHIIGFRSGWSTRYTIYRHRFDTLSFEYFLSVNDKCHVFVRCIKHESIFSVKPEKLINSCPICREDFKALKTPDEEWLDIMPGNIQSNYNGGEFRPCPELGPVDGYCHESNTIYEFNGCSYHGCHVCRAKDRTGHKDPWAKTMNKKKKLIGLGYNYVDIFNCQWIEIKNNEKMLGKLKETYLKLYQSRVRQKNSWFDFLMET